MFAGAALLWLLMLFPPEMGEANRAASLGQKTRSTKFDTSVGSTVDSWEKLAGVEVGDDARRVINNKMWTAGGNELRSHDLEIATEIYLWNLRDANFYDGKFQAEITKDTLGKSDAQEVVQTMSLKKPRGFLAVTSKPDGAWIAIKAEKKGYTNRRFVLSPGEYRIDVGSGSAARCTGRVKVEHDKEVPFACSFE